MDIRVNRLSGGLAVHLSFVEAQRHVGVALQRETKRKPPLLGSTILRHAHLGTFAG